MCCPLRRCSCNQSYHRDRVVAAVLGIPPPALLIHPLWLRPWLSSSNNLSRSTASPRSKSQRRLTSACCWVWAWAALMPANWQISICRNLLCTWLVFHNPPFERYASKQTDQQSKLLSKFTAREKRVYFSKKMFENCAQKIGTKETKKNRLFGDAFSVLEEVLK